jgi:hypothetical protein
MAPKLKAAAGVVSEAVETMCGWAIVVLALYAVLFTNLSGSGTLWDSLRGVARDSMPGPRLRDDVVQEMRVVPVRPPDLAVKAQNHMLLVPEAPDKEISVRVVASEQPRRAPEQITDAPADAGAGKNWQAPHLTSQLRTFTVYGQGEQRAVASGGAAAAPAARARVPAAAVAAAPTPAVSGSAYKIGALTGDARPGISDHVSSEASAPSDGLHNFK